MFTCKGIADCLRGYCSCFNEPPYDERPLLSRTPPPLSPRLGPRLGPRPGPVMPAPTARRTYGSRRNRAAPGAKAIFGKPSTASPIAIRQPASRSPLEELTSKLANTRLQDVESSDEESEEELLPLDENEVVENAYDVDISDDETTLPAPVLPVKKTKPKVIPDGPLKPLLQAYYQDRNIILKPQKWTTILPPNSEILKLAEASYAEVYRITTESGTSIIKVMQLLVPTDAHSLECKTALPVEKVVSELRIMNALTEVPGYVTFKEAHLVKGRPTTDIEEAYDIYKQHAEDQFSYFPDPNLYSQKSTFLVLELGDAGTVLEDWKLQTQDQVWDIFIGTVLALARAESSHEFEHRDLHENNICVSRVRRSRLLEPRKQGPRKYGYSGVEVTIIDYGLSRSKLANGDIMYNDLEDDITLFQSTGHGLPQVQYDCYRRMRAHLSGLPHPKPNKIPNCIPQEKSWQQHTPYTNVLWLRYMLYYLTHQYTNWVNSLSEEFKGLEMKRMKEWEKEIKGLKKGFNFLTKKENGAFQSAGEVLGYLWERGWVGEGDLGVESSVLEGSGWEEGRSELLDGEEEGEVLGEGEGEKDTEEDDE